MAQPPKKKTTGMQPQGESGEPADADPVSGAGARRGTPPGSPHAGGGGSPPKGSRQLGADVQATENAASAATGGTKVASRRASSKQLPASRSGAGSTGRFQPVNSTLDRGARGRDSGGIRRPGALLRLNDLPLSLKFSVPISLLMIAAIAIFGYVSIHTAETRLTEEIVDSGYGQLVALEPFAQKVTLDYSDPKLLAADQALVLKVLEHNPRLYDIAIFGSKEPSDNPSGKVLQGRDATQFAKPPKDTIRVNLPNANSDVIVYRGSYRIKDAGGSEHSESVLYFRMPVRMPPPAPPPPVIVGSTPPKEPEKLYTSLNLIMSAKEIEDEVQALKRKLLLLGILLTAAAVGVALLLARYTTRPIKALVVDMNEVARGNFDHQSPVAGTSNDEVGQLAVAFNRMASSLRAGRESELENQRISGELNTAKAIHIKLMPEKLPQLPGIDIFTAYQSAKEVGGDYYDFIPVGDTEHLALCVADVSGKGIPGSMVMGTTRTILRMMAVGNLSPAEVLAKTNFHVARDIKRGMFVTCVYCVLNVRTRVMSVASAGHNPLLLYRAATGQVEKIRPNGIALGFDKGPVFNRTIREERIELEVGDRVVLYTDGVVEAMDPNRVEWSEEALDAFTLKHATLPSKEYVRLLIKALDEHKGAAEQHDDITVTTFRIV